MNDAPTNDHGLTTAMQQSRWAHALRYVPRDRSLIDKLREHPVTFFICLGAMCAGIVLSVMIPLCGSR